MVRGVVCVCVCGGGGGGVGDHYVFPIQINLLP